MRCLLLLPLSVNALDKGPLCSPPVLAVRPLVRISKNVMHRCCFFPLIFERAANRLSSVSLDAHSLASPVTPDFVTFDSIYESYTFFFLSQASSLFSFPFSLFNVFRDNT